MMLSFFKKIKFLSLVFFALTSVASYAEIPSSFNIDTLHKEIEVLKESINLEENNIEISVEEFGLKDIINRLIAEVASPSPTIQKCHNTLQNKSTLPLVDLLEIMPELVEFAYAQYVKNPASDPSSITNIEN